MRFRIGHLRKGDGTSTLSDKESVEVLSTFFKSAFTVEDTSNIPDFPVRVDSQLNDFYITESDVLDALVALNPNKTPGPDNLHPQLLKNCADSLARPLFCCCLRCL